MLKKSLNFCLVLAFLLGTTFSGSTAFAAGAALQGKIAIITMTIEQDRDAYRSAQEVVKKYGANNVIHEALEYSFWSEKNEMLPIVSKIANDPSVKVLIINQAVAGVNEAIDKLLETRKDMFIVYCMPWEESTDVSKRANLILNPNELKMGEAVPVQAKKLGAKIFVHYSCPRHMSMPILAARRALMKKTCDEIGLEFVDATIPDPTSDVGVSGTRQYILKDVPNMVTKYGKATAFFSTVCSSQPALIKAVADSTAIYPSPCCPSPYHGFPEAFGIDTPNGSMMNIDEMIGRTAEIVNKDGMPKRFSTWSVPASMMFTHAAADYGVKWMKGEIAKNGIDIKTLNACMADYAGTNVDIEKLTKDGITYNNYLLVLEDYFTYGEPLPDRNSPTEGVSVVFKAKKLNLAFPVLSRDGKAYYPMSQLFEILGAKTFWDSAKGNAWGELKANKVEFVADSDKYFANDVRKQANSGLSAFTYNGRTYVSIRYAAEGLGFSVGWDKKTNTIIIN